MTAVFNNSESLNITVLTSLAPTTVSVAGTIVAATTVADTTVAATTVAGTIVADTTVAATTVADTTVAGTTVAGTTIAVCIPNWVNKETVQGYSQGNGYVVTQLTNGLFTAATNKNLLIWNITTQTTTATLTGHTQQITSIFQLLNGLVATGSKVIFYSIYLFSKFFRDQNVHKWQLNSSKFFF